MNEASRPIVRPSRSSSGASSRSPGGPFSLLECWPPSQSTHRAILLNRLLAVLIPIGVACALIQWWARPSAESHFYVVLGAAVAASMAYVLNRMDCYRQAALLMAAVPCVASWVSLWLTPDEFIAFAYPVVGVIVASVLLNGRTAVFFTALNVAGLLLLPLFQPVHSYTAVSAAIGFNLFVPILMVAGMTTRYREERDRREALLESEERWRNLIEYHPDPISISQNGEFMYVNSAALDLLGATSPEQIVGRPIADFVHVSSREDIASRTGMVAEGRRTEPHPFRVMGLDGKERRVEASSVPMTFGDSVAALTVIRNVTEQWMAERGLKESEAKYRAIVEHAPEAIVVIDVATGCFVDCNTNAEELFGLGGARMAASGPIERSPETQPDGTPSAKSWERRIGRALEGKTYAFEWTFAGPAGLVPCEVRLVRLPSLKGVLVRGSITDISTKKQSEAALRASEQRYRTLIDAMGDGLVAVDKERRITLVNSRFREMFRAVGELKGKSLLELVDPEGQAVLQAQAALRSQGISEPYEMAGRRMDGQKIEVRVTPSIIRDENGEYVGSFGVIRDITESNRIERERNLIEAKIRSVVENASDVITVLDQEGRIVFESPSLERMLGYHPLELMGRLVTEFIHDDDVPRVERALYEGAQSPGVPLQIEIRLRHKDGSWRRVEAVGKVLPESLDDWQVVVHTRDITERRRLEHELLAISSREQRRFGQDLHDGMGQILVGARLHAAGLEKRLTAQGADEAELVRVIGTMLDEAHAQARALARSLSPVNLEEGGLLSGLEDLASGLRRIYGVECTLTAGAIEIDDEDTATHLYRIAQEAATNAVRHGNPTQIDLSIEQDDVLTTLKVSDNGTGIDPDAMGRGGMGIPLMRRRATFLSGVLNVSSEPGSTIVTCAFARGASPPEALPSFEA